MKDTNLYFILLLAAIIIFACIGNRYNKKTLEGFEQGQNVQNTFDQGCINACEKEAQENGIVNFKEQCISKCDKLTEQCKFYPFNSTDWWFCLKSVNPNITIPQYIKNRVQENINNDITQYQDNINQQYEDNINQQYQNNLGQNVNSEYDQELQQEYQKELNKLRRKEKRLEYQQGIPRSQIPVGDEDLYILKSQIVPPVCPECPTLNCGNCKTKCPPCPPCARCPEPSFECKKVPNYKAGKNNPYLPVPWLNSFSQFNNQYT